MSTLLEAICCCFYTFQNQRIQPTNNQKKSKKEKRLPKPSRILTKHQKQTIAILSKLQKYDGIPVYTCPICTCFLNKILACNECQNLICRKCVRQYEKKYSLSKHNMRCPFCNSEVCMFLDYEKEPKKYFDTSGSKKIQDKENDSSLGNKGSKYKEKLQEKEIKETKGSIKKKPQEVTSGIPTERNELPLKEIRVLNAMMRVHKEREMTNRESLEESSQAVVLRTIREDNPENTDLSFIEQFELRTVEDASD